jgi:predicted membrane protein
MAPKNLYVNTMIFAVIAAVMTVGLLALLFLIPKARTFAYAIVTFELGLIGIIIYAIFSIFKYESDLKKKASYEAAKVVSIDTCPDYFTNVLESPETTSTSTASATNVKKNVVCKNGYTSGKMTYYFAKRGCGNISMQDKSCFLDDLNLKATNINEYKIDLSNYQGLTAENVCKRVNQKTGGSAFASIPWTDIKSRCDDLALFGSTL